MRILACRRKRTRRQSRIACRGLYHAGNRLIPPVVGDDDRKGRFLPRNTPAKNFYGGVGVDIARNDHPHSNQDGSVSNTSTDESGIGKDLFFGYQISENLANQGGFSRIASAGVISTARKRLAASGFVSTPASIGEQRNRLSIAILQPRANRRPT